MTVTGTARRTPPGVPAPVVLRPVPRPAAPPDDDGLNSVLGKARTILEAFRVEDNELSLADLVRRTGVAKATVHRLCQELLTWGLLERSGTSYRLGLRLFELGQRVPRQRILRDVARPYMEDLLRVTQETVHLAVHDGLDVLYVEKIVGHRAVPRPSRVAGRLPLHSTATGKVVLAFGPAELLDQVLSRGLQRITPSTVCTEQRLREQLVEVRRRAVAIEVEETRMGYCSVAVPVRGHDGQLAAALSVTAPTYRAHVDRLAAEVARAGAAVSRALTAAQELVEPGAAR